MKFKSHCFTKKMSGLVPFIIVIISLAHLDLPAQTGTQNIPKEILLESAGKIISQAKYTTFITLDAEGLPVARIMDPILPNENMEIWMGTNPQSRKVSHIRANPVCVIHYFDPTNPGYVSIRGNAEIINDPVIKQDIWKEEWAEFYSKDKSDLLLIKITPIWLEVISSQDNILGDTISWQPPRVIFN